MTAHRLFLLNRPLLSLSAGLALFSAPFPAQAGKPIELANPGFEDELRSWHEPPRLAGQTGPISVTEDYARTGKKSLKLDGQVDRPKGTPLMVFQTISNLQPNSIYHLSAWAKGGEGGKGSIRAAIKLEYYNHNGENTAGVNGYHSLLENGEWDRVQVVARTDEDTTSVKIYARNLEPNSVIYFDDFEITQPQLLVVEPTRLTHIPGKETPATLKVWSGEGLPKGTRVDLLVSHGGSEETRYPAEYREVGEQTYELTATLPAIDEGHYVITPAIGEDRSPVSARTFASVERRKPENLSATGTILKDGKPFFPIGIYHPQNYTWYRLGATRNDVEGVKDDYARLSEMGFNAVQGSATRNVELFGRYLNEAHKHGLVVDVPFYEGGKVQENLANSLEKIRRFKDHPAVLNWKISDEPDMRPSIVDEVPEAYFAFKQEDPRTPVEVTLATDHALDSWSNFMDIIQINRYPLPGGPLTRVSDYTRLAVENKLPWQNVSYVVQTGWTKKDTEPTPDELRSMVYLALIEGAKGIWYYTMYDPDFDLSKRAIWPYLKEINAEIKALSMPVMLGEHQSEIRSNNALVYSRALEHEGRLYLLLTNPERTPQQATLSLPGKWTGLPAKTLAGEDVPVTTAGSVTLELKALESKTLVFAKSENH